MLSLERTRVLGGNNVAHLLHEVTEPLDLLAVAEALAEDEVEVALQVVAKARGVGVTVPVVMTRMVEGE